jgi:uncharacterized membrane protein YphA (DoxX/SURF4 family)
MEASRESISPRVLLAAFWVVLGVILIVTWFENQTKGLYDPEAFGGFINWLATAGEGHPLGFYRGFLLNVVQPNAAVFAGFQQVTELIIGVALLVGAFTSLAGAASSFFFLNLFLAYLNPGTEEWIWTQVLLLAVALVVALGRAGRSLGVDALLVRSRGEPRFPVY